MLVGLSAGSGGETPESARHFELYVRPLLVEKCHKCHGEEKQEGGLRVDSREALLKGGESGPAIVPGKPDESLLMEAVRHESFEMPPDDQLADTAVDALERWVRQGAVWPKPAGPLRPPAREFTEAERAYWAFQPVTRPAVPAVVSDWCRNEIDAFVWTAMRSRGLTPAPPADRSTLIRRVYYDVLGLPPSRDEVESFVADPRDDDLAYEALIDRLLASPHYGERMAQRWLDVVRYADSDGYKADGFRPTAFRYRDYVIESFNQDVPYDRFLTEQLAGDEVAPHDPRAIAATGFLRLGLYEYNQRDARFHWSLIMDETTEVVGEAFLGLSMACARCHDHKFDPILRADYYRLQSFFAPLLWKERPYFPDETSRQRYLSQQTEWLAATEELRRELEEIEKPIRASLRKSVVIQFPEDVQEIYRKPAGERNWLEDQLAYLVERQVIDKYQELEKKLKGEQKKRWEALRQQLAENRPPEPPSVMSVTDSAARPVATTIPGTEYVVEPGGLAILDAVGDSLASTPPTGRRLALARWLTHPDNPLTARVMANRIWQHYFGTGIVSSANEFGTMGEPPTHPELLDWLASALMHSADPWKMKQLHRQILLSATYRQSVHHPRAAEYARLDGDNRFLWRGNVRRLDAEELRDSVLAAAGVLDLTIGGPSVEEKVARRSLYVKKMRNSPDPWLTAFDAPTGFVSTAVRDKTTTPLQTLLLWNNERVLSLSRKIAQRVLAETGATAAERVDGACWLLLGGRPNPALRQTLIEYLGNQRNKSDEGQEAREIELVTDICHVLINSNVFLYRD